MNQISNIDPGRCTYKTGTGCICDQRDGCALRAAPSVQYRAIRHVQPGGAMARYDPAIAPPGYGNSGFSNPPPAPAMTHEGIVARVRQAASRYRGKWLPFEITDAVTAIMSELNSSGVVAVTEASYLARVRKVVGVTNYVADWGTGSVVWSWSV